MSLYGLTKENHEFGHWKEQNYVVTFNLSPKITSMKKSHVSYVARISIPEDSKLWNENVSEWSFLHDIPIVQFTGEDCPLTTSHLQYLTRCIDLDVRKCKKIDGEVLSYLGSLQSLHVGPIKNFDFITKTPIPLQKLNVFKIQPKYAMFAELKKLTHLTLNLMDEIPCHTFDGLQHLISL